VDSESDQTEPGPPDAGRGELEKVRDEVRSAGVSRRFVEEVATRLLSRDARLDLPPIKDRPAYIRKTARRVAYAENLAWARQRRIASNRPHPSSAESDPSKLAALQEEWRRLQDALVSLLTPEEAWILFGYLYEGKTNKQLASALGVSPQAVNKRIIKLLDRLRRHSSQSDFSRRR
jgi:RNA polymerase sigma factor (sigma-70 family)